jgi:hypothetical protein
MEVITVFSCVPLHSALLLGFRSLYIGVSTAATAVLFVLFRYLVNDEYCLVHSNIQCWNIKAGGTTIIVELTYA